MEENLRPFFIIVGLVIGLPLGVVLASLHDYTDANILRKIKEIRRG